MCGRPTREELTWESASVRCPKCGAMTESAYLVADGTPQRLRCRACPWESETKARVRKIIDQPKATARRTVDNMLAHSWRPTTIKCGKCGGRVMARWWPGKTAPHEIRCADCGHALKERPAPRDKKGRA